MTQRITIRIPDEEYRALTAHASSDETTISKYVRRLINEDNENRDTTSATKAETPYLEDEDY